MTDTSKASLQPGTYFLVPEGHLRTLMHAALDAKKLPDHTYTVDSLLHDCLEKRQLTIMEVG